MTTTTIELDSLDTLAASVFDGYLVRKDLVRKYARQYPVPTYVVEFLLGRYCATVDENEIAEGLEIVERQLKDRMGAGQHHCDLRTGRLFQSTLPRLATRQCVLRNCGPVGLYPDIRGKGESCAVRGN